MSFIQGRKNQTQMVLVLLELILSTDNAVALEIDAVIQFSNQKLSGVNLSTQKLSVKHTPQKCENLFSLVLGKT